MNEFWTERAIGEDRVIYDGPHGLSREVLKNGPPTSIRYHSSIFRITGIGATEEEAISDWLRDAEEDAEEAERELDNLHEAIAAIRELKGE